MRTDYKREREKRREWVRATRELWDREQWGSAVRVRELQTNLFKRFAFALIFCGVFVCFNVSVYIFYCRCPWLNHMLRIKFVMTFCSHLCTLLFFSVFRLFFSPPKNRGNIPVKAAIIYFMNSKFETTTIRRKMSRKKATQCERRLKIFNPKHEQRPNPLCILIVKSDFKLSFSIRLSCSQSRSQLSTLLNEQSVRQLAMCLFFRF